MTQEIKYSGLSANPSDYESPDGDLTTALNLIPEDGQIKPLFQPHDVCTLPVGMMFIHIHKTSTFVHYIAYDPATKRLYWIDASEATGDTRLVREYIQALEYEIGDVVLHPEVGYIKFTAHHNAGAQLTGNEITTISTYPPTLNLIKVFDSGQTIYQVNSIGNTLVVLTNDGINYFLWKGNNEQYHYLGNHIPELPLSFGLQGTPKFGTADNYGFSILQGTNAGANRKPTAGEPIVEFNYGYTSQFDEAIETITQTVLARVNKFINEEVTGEGKFIMPFLVRYAYRLYDGSLIMHSAPILMVPSSGVTPQVYIKGFGMSTNQLGGQYVSQVFCNVGGMVCELDYACISQDAVTALQEWEDIIDSVDVFISSPFYTYDQSGRCVGWELKSEADEEYTISRDMSSSSTKYRKQPFYMLLPNYLNPTTASDLGYDFDYKYRVVLPKHDDEYVKENIRSCANFYLIKSIKLDKINTTRTKIDIPKDYLLTLNNRERMSDDYDSHDNTIPSRMFPYNSRLILANMRKQLAQPFNPQTCFPFCDSVKFLSNNNWVTSIDVHNVLSYVNIKQEGRQIVVKSPSGNMAKYSALLYYFYPNINARKAILEFSNSGNTEKNVFTLPLENHTNLNGAVFFEGWNPTIEQTGYVAPGNIPSGTIPNESTDKTVSLTNKIYTSEVNNPFLFPVTSIISVGTGTILGISSAAKALSQGQFGQFPLYALCSDGVWALEVANDGTFSARQPITRDVCVNPDSITQIDNAVLFATDRGIMLLSGSTATCITDVIATEYPFDILANLPHANDLHSMLGHDTDTCLPTQPFLTFLNGCRMVYDYLHQHILVYNPNFTYAYVFSLKSKLWGMTYSNLKSTLNSYPDALAMADGDKLVSFSSTDETVCKGLLVTRPIKLGDGNALKSIHTLLQRGFFHEGYVKTVLYGSRDIEHWHIIASSSTHAIRNLRGTPYKYFRIAAVATLAPNKSLHGATIDFETRHTNVIH